MNKLFKMVIKDTELSLFCSLGTKGIYHMLLSCYCIIELCRNVQDWFGLLRFAEYNLHLGNIF